MNGNYNLAYKTMRKFNMCIIIRVRSSCFTV